MPGLGNGRGKPSHKKTGKGSGKKVEVLVPATRTRADVVLAQGAIPLPKRGPRGVGKGKGGVKKPQWKNVLNALHPSVPGLPRAVGPYTVASTTTSFKVPAGGPKF